MTFLFSSSSSSSSSSFVSTVLLRTLVSVITYAHYSFCFHLLIFSCVPQLFSTILVSE
ncbi:hypothetical protein L9F63_012539, partial [Diploptera punctata]